MRAILAIVAVSCAAPQPQPSTPAPQPHAQVRGTEYLVPPDVRRVVIRTRASNVYSVDFVSRGTTIDQQLAQPPTTCVDVPEGVDHLRIFAAVSVTYVSSDEECAHYAELHRLDETDERD